MVERILPMMSPNSLGRWMLAAPLCLLSGLAWGQAPEGFRPQTPDEVPTTGRAGGTGTRSESGTLARSNTRNLRNTSSRDTYVRVSRAPNMFGDTLPPLVSLGVGGDQGTGQLTQDTLYTAPLGGGGSFNASENNTALPTDRVYFIYNAFYNAASTTVNGDPNFFLPVQRSIDLHRYLIGFEKTFLDGNVSIDVRMPFFSGFDFNSFGVLSDSGNIGNLTMYMKGLLYSNETSAVASGLGIGLPTGSDLQTTAPFAQERVTIRNDAVSLMPFMAATLSPNENWFIQSFAQINFAASGNQVVNQDGLVGIYNEQHLGQIDLGVGRWLWHDATRPYVSGLAGVMELHYTSTLQDTDTVELPEFNFLSGNLSNAANRVDLLNLTSGLHLELGPMSSLRVGAVVPLRNAPERVFDSELQVSFNRKF